MLVAANVNAKRIIPVIREPTTPVKIVLSAKQRQAPVQLRKAQEANNVTAKYAAASISAAITKIGATVTAPVITSIVVTTPTIMLNITDNRVQ